MLSAQQLDRIKGHRGAWRELAAWMLDPGEAVERRVPTGGTLVPDMLERWAEESPDAERRGSACRVARWGARVVAFGAAGWTGGSRERERQVVDSQWLEKMSQLVGLGAVEDVTEELRAAPAYVRDVRTATPRFLPKASGGLRLIVDHTSLGTRPRRKVRLVLAPRAEAPLVLPADAVGEMERGRGAVSGSMTGREARSWLREWARRHGRSWASKSMRRARRAIERAEAGSGLNAGAPAQVFSTKLLTME